jgi:hypothetical protein
MRCALALRLASVAALGWALSACATGPERAGSPQLGERQQIVAVIRRYYESNAAEQNNACSAPIMTAVSRTQVVSDSDDGLVVDVTYTFGNYASRSANRCRGFGNRQFTLTRSSDGFEVVDMTGERRLGARWRLW